MTHNTADIGKPGPYRLAVVNSHPIQYFAPLFRRLAQEPDIDLTVYFCSRQGVEEYTDPQFARRVKWDIPLLDGYRSHFLTASGPGAGRSRLLRLANPAIVAALWRGRYDALWVHGHNSITYLLAIVAARAFGIPVLMRCETHNGLRRSAPKRLLRSLVMPVLYRWLCAACLPIGTRNRQFYRSLGVNDDRLFLVPYVVDNAFFAAGAERAREEREQRLRALGLPADLPLILYASKLVPRKRPLDLLLAYERIRRMGTEAALVIVGSGSEEASLRAYVKEHQVPDVHFLGFQNQARLPEIYGLCDVFVLPSENEPWGLVINETMAAALPVVATEEIGAVADLVAHGDNGFLYPAGDIPALASHLRVLVSDAEMRRAMGKQSCERIRCWDVEQCVRGIHNALRFVSGMRSSGGHATENGR